MFLVCAVLWEAGYDSNSKLIGIQGDEIPNNVQTSA